MEAKEYWDRIIKIYVGSSINAEDVDNLRKWLEDEKVISKECSKTVVILLDAYARDMRLIMKIPTFMGSTAGEPRPFIEIAMQILLSASASKF